VGDFGFVKANVTLLQKLDLIRDNYKNKLHFIRIEISAEDETKTDTFITPCDTGPAYCSGHQFYNPGTKAGVYWSAISAYVYY
jgi:hypothetical protein